MGMNNWTQLWLHPTTTGTTTGPAVEKLHRSSQTGSQSPLSLGHLDCEPPRMSWSSLGVRWCKGQTNWNRPKWFLANLQTTSGRLAEEFTFHLFWGRLFCRSVNQKPSQNEPGIWLRPHISHLMVTIPEPKGSRKTRYGTSIVAPRSKKSKKDSIWPLKTARKC